MRIIAGEAGGRKLVAPEGLHTRPTLERVKEGMFSSLHRTLPGARVLDLFAGSGQLGLEALSRGALHCVFVEKDARALAALQQNVRASGLAERCTLVRGDAATYLARCRETFDLVLLDPPFEAGFLPGQLPAVSQVCAENAQVVCESGQALDFPETAGDLQQEKQYKYGTVLVYRYRRMPKAGGEHET